MWPFVAKRVISLKELRWSCTVLTSPRTVREISRSSVPAARRGLVAVPNPPPGSGVERLTLRHFERPWTSFRLGWVFSCLWSCLGSKTRASGRLTGTVLVLCALRGFASTQDAAWRGGTLRARAGCRFVLSTLLAAIALFAASTVSTHAQTRNWTGAVSSNWFLSGNWDSTFPRQTDDGIINTVTSNSTEISQPGRSSQNLTIGANGTGMLTILAGGTLVDQFGTIGNLPGGVGTVIVTGLGSSWTNVNDVVVGGQGTGTLTIQDHGTVRSDGGSVGLDAGSTGTVTVTGPGSTWTNSQAAGSISAILARAHS